ncbi:MULTISPECIES: DUF4377 domain-containing protein [Vibrio]|uniref:DUF4377 domain-containing protein n=1 Tax=Vibrio TaxID=662 RepID=UPI000C85F60D|nr:DUF4377 domain-containing protein [Vibrio splendidus]PMO16451.1 hypothetical protein BCT15_24200 [Vibrio splendidus]
MKQYLLLAGVSLLIGCDQTNSKADSTHNETTREKVMMTIEVGSEKVDCVGVAPMKCLVVDGALFYDHITDFEFEAGYEYTLQVEKTQRFTSENVPADASLYQYRLIKELEKHHLHPSTELPH